MKNPRNHAGHQVALKLALIGLMSAATLVLGPVRLASAQAVYPSWSDTGNLNTGRVLHSMTLLPNGKVLVAGGYTCFPCVEINTAELYDPTTGSWSYTGNLNTARINHTATLLPNGKVLVVGGFRNVFDRNSLDSAELYDPATGKWSTTGSLNTARDGQTATLLPNGKVLVAGGGYYTNMVINPGTSAELYDPGTGRWSSTGNLTSARWAHTATLLPGGKVLIAGGFEFTIPASSELYDPATGTWSFTGNLNSAHYTHTAILLANGKVMVVGGQSNNSAELYDPATGTWSRTGSLNYVLEFQTTALLTNGRVLATGVGLNAELYDPATGTWTITAEPNLMRNSRSTPLPNGRVLIAGGYTIDGPYSWNTAELYDPSASPNSNLVDDARFFVREHYVDFLDREPEADGLAYWTDRIVQCGSDAHCIHERRIGVSAAFFIEMEFQETGYYVYRFYKASFDRQPNYAEFTVDRALYCEDCSTLEESKQYFADQWVLRAAFTQAYPNTISNTEVINKLFDTAGLTASIYDPQRQQEIQAMNAGRSRALVLRDVIEIPDFKNVPDPNSPRYSELKQISQYNPAFVLMQYFGYLHRDLDRDGYDFWLDVVNNREPNNYHGMVCSFLTSSEYQLRFGSSVTRSNADCSR